MENNVLKLTKLALQNLRDYVVEEEKRGPPSYATTPNGAHDLMCADIKHRLNKILAALGEE